MTRRVLLAAGALAVGLSVAVAVGDDDERPTYKKVSGDPVLTENQRRIARRLLRADERLSEALRGNPLRIAQMGPWLSAGHRFIGASAVVPLRTRRSYAMREWPLVDGDPPGDAAYVVDEVPMRLTGVSEFLVEVDLKLRRVVGINPGGDDMRGEYGPGVELSEPTGY
jgi:hypothetical protein